MKNLALDHGLTAIADNISGKRLTPTTYVELDDRAKAAVDIAEHFYGDQITSSASRDDRLNEALVALRNAKNATIIQKSIDEHLNGLISTLSALIDDSLNKRGVMAEDDQWNGAILALNIVYKDQINSAMKHIKGIGLKNTKGAVRLGDTISNATNRCASWKFINNNETIPMDVIAKFVNHALYYQIATSK